MLSGACVASAARQSAAAVARPHRRLGRMEVVTPMSPLSAAAVCCSTVADVARQPKRPTRLSVGSFRSVTICSLPFAPSGIAGAGRGERLQAGLGHRLEQAHADQVRRGAHRHVRGHVQRLARGVGQRVLRRLQRVGGAVGVGAGGRLVRRDAEDGLAAVEGLAGVGDQALLQVAAEARVGDRVAAGVAVAGEHHHRVERAGLRRRALAVAGVAGDARRLLELRARLARLRGEDRVARPPGACR